MKRYISKSEQDTAKLAEKFVDNLLKNRGKDGGKTVLILLKGDLGSGKTTFTKAVAARLGIKDTVTSPTFVLEKIYKIPPSVEKSTGYKHLIHIDAYRLDGGAELSALGWDEMLENPKNLVFMEWPEKVSDGLPKNTLQIEFKTAGNTIREITF